jgi:hypothetical protein
MKSILFITFCLVALVETNAQSAAQCTRALTQAELAFDQGRLLTIINGEISQFQKCLKDGIFTKEEQIRAYKLLTKTYIFLDREREAEENLIKLLGVDKEHNLAKDDPSELYFLYDKFKTEPIFRVGFRVGINFSNPYVMQSFNTSNEPKKYNADGAGGMGVGFWAEALFEKYLNNGIELAGGPQIQIANYKVESEFGDLTYNIQNQSVMVRIPIIARYNFGYDKRDIDNNRAKFIPYVFLGSSFDYLVNAKYVNTSRTGGTAFTLQSDAEQASLSDRDQVAMSNVSLIGGIGMKLRVQNVNFFTFELRYNNSLFNYINTDNRFSNPFVGYDNAYIEDDLTINTFAVSIGYTLSLYKPRKRKQYR